MRVVEDLTKEELRQIVYKLQELLYLDNDDSGKTFWNPDKEWDIAVLEYLADSLHRYGLVPTGID